MPIVTITSDFGSADHYVGMLKGALLSVDATLRVIDISHNVPSFDIVQAAYILKNAYPSFPKGSIHLLGINTLYQPMPTFVAMRRDGHFFVAPDNGLLSLMFDAIDSDIYEIEYSDRSTFPLEQVFGMAVAHIIAGKPFNEIGIQLDAITERLAFQPVRSSNQLKGTVIYIDQYENAITNIQEDLFEEVRNERAFRLYFKRMSPLDTIHQYYADVPVGTPVCLFNSAGYLELAINMGKAASLLGIQLEDMVQIDFED